MTPPRLGQALRLLAQAGFTQKRSRGLIRIFDGLLETSAGNVAIRVELQDWNFLEYPTIRVIERPSFFPELVPHVGTRGDICYFRHGSVVLDRFNPAGSIKQCLDRAREVLEQIVADPARRTADIQDEFLHYWFAGQTAIWPVVLGGIAASDEIASYFVLGEGDDTHVMIATSRDEAARYAKCLGLSGPKGGSVGCWILRSDIYPSAPAKLPTTVKQLFEYIRSWDRRLSTAIQTILERRKEYLQHKYTTFAVDTPAGWIGFGFNLNQAFRLGYQKKPALYKQYLHGKGGSQPIFRLLISDVSPAFIHTRNILGSTLMGKRVTLVGCGAIGGFLAAALARFGAGSGANGRLRLVDPGLLGPENVGRHLLGLNHQGHFKANAVADELKRSFPEISVLPSPREVNLDDDLSDNDLVIDATGIEAVSDMLNAFHRSTLATIPYVHAWIHGNGDCVQALWVDSPKHGCYRCLRMPEGPRYREERFPVAKKPTIGGFVGCQAFTPYAVSAPLSASALVIDMIANWLAGSPSPRFRTRTIEQANLCRVKNQDITPISGCPACLSHSS